MTARSWLRPHCADESNLMRELHQEHMFEDEICAALAARGWLYRLGDAEGYDRTRALFPADVIVWIRETQPKAWEALTRTHGAAAESVLLDRLRKSLDDRGTLDMLRNGLDTIGVRGRIALAQFRPATGLNPDLLARYTARAVAGQAGS